MRYVYFKIINILMKSISDESFFLDKYKLM